MKKYFSFFLILIFCLKCFSQKRGIKIENLQNFDKQKIHFGYFIGLTLIDLAMNVVQFYGYEEKVVNLKNDLTSGGGFYLFLGTLFLAGFTPLPYKAFTITSGLIDFNLSIFVIVSFISRSFRFFIIAYLSYKFGDLFTQFMKKNGSKWFTVIGVLIVLILGIMYFFQKFNA